MYVAVRLCGTTLQAHRALRSRRQKERVKIKKQPREMMLATCDSCAEQMCATCHYSTIHPRPTTRARVGKKRDGEGCLGCVSHRCSKLSSITSSAGDRRQITTEIENRSGLAAHTSL